MKQFFQIIFLFLCLPILGMKQQELIHQIQDDIFNACRRGDITSVRRCIKQLLSVGESLDPVCQEKGDLGATPLVLAACHGHCLVISELIRNGADIHYRVSCGDTYMDPLCFAVIFGETEAVLALIQAGAQINRAVNDLPRFITPIKIAIGCNRPQICSLLVIHGASLWPIPTPPFPSQDGSVIEYAAKHNRKECLRKIVCSAFFLPNEKDKKDALLKASVWVARTLVSQIPFCESFKPISPREKIKTLLLCFERLKVIQDLRKLLLCSAVRSELVEVLSCAISKNKKIPIFALDVMLQECYKSTANKLKPLLEQAFEQYESSAVGPLLNPINFEENYGKELRANIRARLANPYHHMANLVNVGSDVIEL